MKSTLIEKNAKKEQEYPFLGIAEDGDVVLFYAKNIGTVVRHGGHSPAGVGYWEEDWDMDCFTPLEGSVLLEN